MTAKLTWHVNTWTGTCLAHAWTRNKQYVGEKDEVAALCSETVLGNLHSSFLEQSTAWGKQRCREMLEALLDREYT